ncbi:MAG: ATP-grasp domain-containing protein [Dyella sp.]|uniref:ATP-grasp domain-containing protein n=1 Tax=Dyella sp. TaxID=1869338 RepID=UPI003F823EBA
MVQLQAAREVGLSFPELVVTNDVRDVKMMLERWPKLVFKTFYPHSWRSEATGKVFSISVKLLDRDSELPEEAIALSPGIFQRYIEKAYDVRVTIIGDRFFSVQMRQNDGVAYVDWRDHMEDEDMLMEVVSIPAPIEDKLRALMKRLGLVYGCIDLVVDREGNVYFLEVNQAGQFLFLEEALPGLPLMRAMTAMLASGCVNYSLEDGGRFNFSDFLSTDDYQEVIRTQIRSVMPNQSRAVEA